MDKNHIDMKRKCKEETEWVNDNVSAFMRWNIKRNS